MLQRAAHALLEELPQSRARKVEQKLRVYTPEAVNKCIKREIGNLTMANLGRWQSCLG
jgi:hypothetical protein